ncbi:MAG: Lrp/AsnC family transcriptional regulator, partial [Candidatus Aenigmarchaeota archaeon]|nr:Lrp/AsnC family transcriptional regulator [Candidatus Aenigmarchaeota archaeon]
MYNFDEKDIDILNLLNKDAKLTSLQISKKTGIPATTIHNRIKKMEANGIILRYSIVTDTKKLGMKIKAYIMVCVEYMTPAGRKISQTELAQEIKEYPLVDEVSIITGGTDILVKVHSKDVDELNDFIINKLRSVDGVAKTDTMIV